MKHDRIDGQTQKSTNREARKGAVGTKKSRKPNRLKSGNRSRRKRTILSPAQKAVVLAVAQGLTTKQIAEQLNQKKLRSKPVSPRVVEHLRSSAKTALRATTAGQMIAEAVRLREIAL